MSAPIDANHTDDTAHGAISDSADEDFAAKAVARETSAALNKLTSMVSRGQAGSSPGSFSSRLLSVGFIFALILSVLCLGFSTFYLFQYLGSANTGIMQVLDKVAAQQVKLETGQLEVLINGRLVMARLGLLSCGVLAGVSFGFLGFALFLLGIKETMDVSLEHSNYKANAARMSPGVFLIVVAAVLIGVCATRETPFNYSIEETKPSTLSPTPTPNSLAHSSPTPEVKATPQLAPRIGNEQP